MEISHRTQDHILIVTPKTTSLNAKEVPKFKEHVIQLIATHTFEKVIFDLQHLHFIDNSGLGSFLSMLRLIHIQGGKLKLAQMNRYIQTMLELSSMHKSFESFPSMEEAIHSFNASTEG